MVIPQTSSTNNRVASYVFSLLLHFLVRVSTSDSTLENANLVYFWRCLAYYKKYEKEL